MRVRSILVFLCLVFSVLSASGQDVSTQESKRDRLQKEIEIIDKQLKANASKNADALNTLSMIQHKIELRRSLIKESDRYIAGVESDIRKTNRRIDTLRRRLDTLSLYYEKLVRSAYKNRDARVWYVYILASDNLAQGLRRFAFLRDLSSQMNRQGEQILASRQVLQDERQRLSTLIAEAQALRSDRVKELNSLQDEEALAKKTVNSLKNQRTKYQSQLKAKQKEVEALNKEIARIIAESVKASSARSGNKKSKQVIDYTLAKEFASNKGKLPWPVEGPVVETFGVHYHPVYTQIKLPASDGISIAVDDGTKVRAVFDGVVKNIIVQPGYNKCVLVQHGDHFTFYCKLGSVDVKAGDKVKTGQVLGAVQAIGGTSQLHFQLWTSNGPQNPELWLRSR